MCSKTYESLGIFSYKYFNPSKDLFLQLYLSIHEKFSSKNDIKNTQYIIEEWDWELGKCIENMILHFKIGEISMDLQQCIYADIISNALLLALNSNCFLKTIFRIKKIRTVSSLQFLFIFFIYLMFFTFYMFKEGN